MSEATPMETSCATTQCNCHKSATNDNVMLKCVCVDGKKIEMPLGVAKLSKTLDNMIGVCEGDQNFSSEIPFAEEACDKPTMEKIIEWGKYHLANPKAPPTAEEKKTKPFRDDKVVIEIDPWDKNFMGTNVEEIVKIMTASNYLEIENLTLLCAKTLALMIKGKTPQQIRDMFGIVNDFSPEEEEQIRRENAWCEER